MRSKTRSLVKGDRSKPGMFLGFKEGRRGWVPTLGRKGRGSGGRVAAGEAGECLGQLQPATFTRAGRFHLRQLFANAYGKKSPHLPPPSL